MGQNVGTLPPHGASLGPSVGRLPTHGASLGPSVGDFLHTGPVLDQVQEDFLLIVCSAGVNGALLNVVPYTFRPSIVVKHKLLEMQCLCYLLQKSVQHNVCVLVVSR